MLSPKRRSLNALALALVFAFANVALALQGGQAGPIEFKLKTADGGEINSEMLHGDVVVLAFGASWLPLTRAQVEGVQKLADQYSERNVRVYWVSTDSVSPKSKNYATDGQLRDFAKRHGLKVAVLRDPEGALLKELHIDQVPSVVILDRTGNVSGSPVGGLDPNGNLADQLAPRLNRLLAGN
jgi:peroxiredoxin